METMSYQKLLKTYEKGKNTVYQEYRCNKVSGKIVWMSFTTTMEREPDSKDFSFSAIYGILMKKRKLN